MTNLWLATMTVVAALLPTVMTAQYGKERNAASKDAAMSMAYVGCVKTLNHGAAFLLTGVPATHGMETTATKTFTLVGPNLAKHVGHQVSITGSVSDDPMGPMGRDVRALTVKKLKVIARSCS